MIAGGGVNDREAGTEEECADDFLLATQNVFPLILHEREVDKRKKI